MRTKDKTFVVTGGGSGLGQQLVVQLLNRGSQVVAIDIREAGLEETRRLTGGNDRLSTHATDVADKDAVRRLFDWTLDRRGHVDGLINNAGIIQPFVRILDLEDESIERVMNVNFFGTLNMIRTFLPHLLTRPEAHIVNVSSMGGLLPVPGQAVYCASKAAVKLLSEALFAELLETSVRVTTVVPGAVATNIVQNSNVELPAQTLEDSAALAAEEAAARVIEGVEENEYRVLVGSDAYISDKLARIMPETAMKLIQKRMRSLLD